MKVEPVVECVEAVRSARRRTPATWSCSRRKDAGSISRRSSELAEHKRILLLCGRYEGFDERIRLILEPDEISIGDFVLNGGEVAAMVDHRRGRSGWCRACWETKTAARAIRFRASRRWLECAQYTRPREYRGLRGAADPAERQPRGDRPLERREQPPADAASGEKDLLKD